MPHKRFAILKMKRKFQKITVGLSLAALNFSGLTAAFAQQRTPPAQTPRQALIEMLTGGEKAWLKHMTVEAQQALTAQKTTSFIVGSPLGMLRGQAGGDDQTFESGPVLFSIVDKNDHSKVEIRLDGDDLNGAEDTMQISIHKFRDGEEQKEDSLGMFSPEIQVAWKQQENVWRLNEIRVSAVFPIGDAQFLKKLVGPGSPAKASDGDHSTVRLYGPATTVVLPTDVHVEVQPAEPTQVVQVLGFAESTFATLHPEIGFTCSLSELFQDGNVTGVDPQVAAGPYNGYKFALAGCQGKPAGSFQVTAEPLVAGAGKAYCTDATHNLRIADDGRALTCLSAGRLENVQNETTTAQEERM